MADTSITFGEWFKGAQELERDAEFFCVRLLGAGIDPCRFAEAKRHVMLPPFPPKPEHAPKKRQEGGYVRPTRAQMEAEWINLLGRWAARYGDEHRGMTHLLNHISRVARGDTNLARKYRSMLYHKGVTLKPDGGWEWGSPPTEGVPGPEVGVRTPSAVSVTRPEVDALGADQTEKENSWRRKEDDYMTDPDVQDYFIRNKIMSPEEVMKAAKERSRHIKQFSPEPANSFDPSNMPPPVVLPPERDPSNLLRKGWQKFSTFVGDRAKRVGHEVRRGAEGLATAYRPMVGAFKGI